MKEVPKTIIGISPGTTMTGIAILIDGDLVDYKVLNFKEKWSRRKLSCIQGKIIREIEAYKPTRAALKIPKVSYTSNQLKTLIRAIVQVLEQKSIRIASYTVKDYKEYCLPLTKHNPHSLAKFAFSKFPELRSAYEKHQKNHRYRIKVFEAICSAIISHHHA